ncbi:hypothetical protein [Halobacteriovorax sp. JY17]|uniref:hypothetical protein n=1 Tax=Halobacteriovorax sp. JY17 TaxID=2014617 RepID=UPI000C60D376|nr:hypothetical protein [Halobacteriovorax sp. JY17]PIK15757.1 MAG: hypothetical protein CES88_03245 [Halobacteriovorax sp. JY17]
MKSLIITGLLILCFNSFAVDRETPFEVSGKITNYYGYELSAEAIMWSNALKSCEDIGLVNKLSKVKFETSNHFSTATARFVCLRVGSGE